MNLLNDPKVVITITSIIVSGFVSCRTKDIWIFLLTGLMLFFWWSYGDKMRKITQSEFDILPVENGFKICPTGDYSEIKNFGNSCSFGESCSFGNSCSFGEWCSFGNSCSFGELCRFGNSCSFGESCRFGEWCGFGESCRFGKSCRFGEWCGFGESCRFGESCSFGGKKTNQKFVRSLSGLGHEKRTLYVWLTEDGVYCQAGCFFDTESVFRKAVVEKYGEDADYLKALDLLKSLKD